MNALLQEAYGGLAPYAVTPQHSRGRLITEPESQTRTAFERDRDRIIHSGAFRKLRNKTQVFIENEGDYYRTRLTHSLEVAQISRSLAKNLKLNMDLAETLALAHDIGHTCFGHAGEWALDAAMRPYGGFSHNEQTFRILTKLEIRYASFDGLNLTWETLEGVVKHNGPVLLNQSGVQIQPDGGEGEKTGILQKPPKTYAAIKEFDQKWSLELETHASAEAQIAAIADDIAYNTHDIDDGYRAGFFGVADLAELPLFGPVLAGVRRDFPHVEEQRQMHEVVRQVIGILVADVLKFSQQNIAELAPKDAKAVRMAGKTLIDFSPELHADIKILRQFLQSRMYRHSRVNRACAKAERIVKDLFAVLMDKPGCLPESWQNALQKRKDDASSKARLIADYIAGMTDRFAVQEHRRLFSTETMI